MPRGDRRAFGFAATYFFFWARALMADRMDSGPRDLHRPDGIQRLPSVHVTCKR